MGRDTSPASVAKVVASAERLRMELLDALRRTDKAQAAGVHTELVMLYGQAFLGVFDACAADLSPGPGKLKSGTSASAAWRSTGCGRPR